MKAPASSASPKAGLQKTTKEQDDRVIAMVKKNNNITCNHIQKTFMEVNISLSAMNRRELLYYSIW